MHPARIVGIVLLVLGAVLIGLAYQGSQSFGDQTKHFFSGNFSEKTTQLMIGGVVSAVAGLIALVVPVKGKVLGGAG